MAMTHRSSFIRRSFIVVNADAKSILLSKWPPRNDVAKHERMEATLARMLRALARQS
jgi:hypothetical protein